jgi:hypothetical protein
MSFFGFYKTKKSFKLDIDGVYSSRDFVEPLNNGEITVDQIEDIAKAGNLSCQEFISEMTLAGLTKVANGDLKVSDQFFNTMINRFIKYATLAAEQGHGDLQYNLGLTHVKKVDLDDGYIDEEGLDHIRKAYYWYTQAANNPSCNFRKKAKKSAESMKSILEGLS